MYSFNYTFVCHVHMYEYRLTPHPILLHPNVIRKTVKQHFLRFCSECGGVSAKVTFANE